MPRRAECVVFFGDIKGTKAALQGMAAGGHGVLESRLSNLQSAFVSAFLALAPRSRSLRAATFSDSVVAQWTDVSEACRFVNQFSKVLWNSLDHGLLLFRGFIDSGDIVEERDALGLILDQTQDRFVRVMPLSVAMWSVAVAEASHFPTGIFVGSSLVNRLEQAAYKPESLKADQFEYRQLDI